MGTGPGALMAGGGIAAVTRPEWRVPAVLLGVATLTALAIASGYRGWSRQSATVGLAERAFGGAWGGRVVAVLILLGVGGWFGFYVGLSAGALQQLWGWSPALTGIVFGTGLWLLYRTGFSRWNGMVAVTGIGSLAVAAMVARSVVGQPSGSGPELGGAPALVFVVGVVVAYAAVFALRAPDFTWDARTGGDVVRAGVVLAVTLATFLLIGTAIYNRAGSFDLARLVTATRQPEAGALLLISSAIAPAVSGLHSGAITLRRVAGWHPLVGGALVAAVGAVLGATRFDLRLLAFLGVLGAIMPPALGVILLRSRRNADWHAWAGWGLGSAVALVMLAVGLPAHILVGVTLSGAVVTVLGVMSGRGVERSVSPG